jgi:beta-galactosidase/beta-glucuronidase
MNLEHPRPQLQRLDWQDLSGTWEFCFDDHVQHQHPETVSFDREILVPYAPESPASGLGDQGFHRQVWYRKVLRLSPKANHRVLLHFQAVDHHARVWVNGCLVAEHIGGYTPFSADISRFADTELEIVVQVVDNPHDLGQVRGKQDWLPEPHAIWYPRTTGIWQMVWLEQVPSISIKRLHWSSHVERWSIDFEADLDGQLPKDAQLRLRLWHRQTLLVDDICHCGQQLQRSIVLPDPGIDDAREELLWSPEHPNLLEAELTVLAAGEVLDTVKSYTALRSVGLRDSVFCLNARPYFLRLALDQGYWAEGHLSASLEQLHQDVILAKRLGFNGVRKHQKIEDPRWLHCCDRLGLLVWEEMPSAYRFDWRNIKSTMQQWAEVLERDRSHPCIVAWMTFNESWGVPDLPLEPRQRDLVRAMYYQTKALDPSRPVLGNDGWEYVAGDVLGIHDYESDPEVLRQRYHSPTALENSLLEVKPGGRWLRLDDSNQAKPTVLSEFGGIAYSQDSDLGWGYARANDASEFLQQYQALMQAVWACQKTLAGFCYTQLTDTFQEKNGLLDMNRLPKADWLDLACATRGLAPEKRGEVQMNPQGYSKRWRELQQKKEQEV